MTAILTHHVDIMVQRLVEGQVPDIARPSNQNRFKGK